MCHVGAHPVEPPRPGRSRPQRGLGASRMSDTLALIRFHSLRSPEWSKQDHTGCHLPVLSWNWPWNSTGWGQCMGEPWVELLTMRKHRPGSEKNASA